MTLGQFGRFSAVLCLLALLLAACGTAAGITTQVANVVEPTATMTPLPPTATATTPPPTATATVAPTATPTAVPTATRPAATATATTRPAPTATVAPTRPAATVAPTRQATGGQVVKDEDSRCQMVLPAGLTEDAPGKGEYTVVNDGGFGVLLSTPNANPGDFQTVVDAFMASFTPIIGNYAATNTTKTATTYRADFTGEVAKPGKGMIYFKQVNQVACGIVLFVDTGASFQYDQAVATMIGTLDAAKP